jgi:serine/threonine protein kinase
MGENFAESIQLILMKKQIPLSKKKAETPVWLSDLIERLLEKNPSKRITSATEALQNIKSHSDYDDQNKLVKFIQDPSDTRSDLIEVDETSGKFSKKTRPLFIFLSMIAIVIIIVFFFFQRNETVNPNSNNKNLLQKRSIDDSIQIVSESNLDTSKSTESKSIKNDPAKRPAPLSNPDLDISDIDNDLQNKKAELSQKEIIPKVKPGNVFISTYPWAKIFIDGKYQETTPLKEPIQLEAGTYKLRLENPHFVAIEQTLNIQPEMSDTLNFNLEPSIGFLNIQVIPWAEVYIDGEYKETTPLEDPISLPAGKHYLKLVNPNLSTWSDSINIQPGRTFTKQISLLN